MKFKINDHVKVIGQTNGNGKIGKIGTINAVDPVKWPYRVIFEDNYFSVFKESELEHYYKSKLIEWLQKKSSKV